MKEHDTNWHLLEYDAETHKTKYVKFEDGQVWIRETIPDWLAHQIIEENKARALAWTGWKDHKFGAVVSSVPEIINNQWKKAAGYDPTKGAWYDRDKYNAFLDDSDYRHFRTGGGKIGKRKAEVVWSPKKLAKIAPLPMPKLDLTAT